MCAASMTCAAQRWFCSQRCPEQSSKLGSRRPRQRSPVVIETEAMRKLAAELLGTFILVFGGCGAAVFSAAFPAVGIGLTGVSLAFGLTVLGCAYALGPVSGCHLNPAVTVGFATSGRFAWREVPGYIVAQVVGGVIAAGVLVYLLKGQPQGYDPSVGGLAANGYGDHSPGKYAMAQGLVTEVILTFIFISVILGATSKRAVSGFAGIPIGLTLTLVHLVGIPVTNVSVNPARSTGPAVFVGGWAVEQLWLFWLAPLVGAVLAGLLAAWLHEEGADFPAKA
jgi:aquaporin Z